MNYMNILLVGSGGREHAIACTFSKSPKVKLFAAMATPNQGIIDCASSSLITDEKDCAKIVAFCKEHQITHAFIGPEAPLEAGICDVLSAAGVTCASPSKAAARIETDKAFCRNLMSDYNILGCPEYHYFADCKDAISFLEAHADIEYAIKPVGLTGGKGVRIIGEHVDFYGAKEYIQELKHDIVLEERLFGEEFTLQAFVDGKTLLPMPLVQDHKRAFEGDTGPNTGGMGSYSMLDHRLPFVSEDDYNTAFSIMKSVVSALAEEGTPYIGVLYGQFMNTKTGPMVIEFNARFGDPEAMNVMSLLDSDAGDLIEAMTTGTLDQFSISFAKQATVCIYLVPTGYPENPQSDCEIVLPETSDALLYYANVRWENDHLITGSSRSLAFVGMGMTLEDARVSAISAASEVLGEVRFRTDIGTAEVLERRIIHMKTVRGDVT
jgi:phosphoribosylamine--glycine ligase